MKNLAILFLLLATPAQANTLTLICTGKNGEIDMVPGTAILDFAKLTFRPPWRELTYSINRVTETEISFSLKNKMLYSHGTLDRVTGRVEYSSTTYFPNEPPDTSLQVGVCKPAKPLF